MLGCILTERSEHGLSGISPPRLFDKEAFYEQNRSGALETYSLV